MIRMLNQLHQTNAVVNSRSSFGRVLCLFVLGSDQYRNSLQQKATDDISSSYAFIVLSSCIQSLFEKLQRLDWCFFVFCSWHS